MLRFIFTVVGEALVEDARRRKGAAGFRLAVMMLPGRILNGWKSEGD